MPFEPDPNYRPESPVEKQEWPQGCRDTQHAPPHFISIPPGMRYRHRCPSCGDESVVYPTITTFST
jgi:hypothetical protein